MTRSPPNGAVFYWLLAVITAVALVVPASGSPVPKNGMATTTVADTVYLADGTGATENLIITWPAFVTASGTAVAGGSTTAALGADGALNMALVPNAGATPAGVYYTVVYQIVSGDVKTEHWIVPATSPTNLTTKANASAVVHLRGEETISGAKSFAMSPNVPAPQNSSDIATKGYVDQSVSNVGLGSYLATAGGTLTGPLT